MPEAETNTDRTLGQQLAEQATMMMARRAMRLAGNSAAAEVQARLDALPQPARSRRRRIEVPVAHLGADTEHPPELRWPSSADLLETPASRPAGQSLDATTAERLRPLLGGDLPPLRVREDAAGDQLARSHDADAVTVGDEIFFRTGYFAPTEPTGFALLAHEAVHAAANHDSAASWHRSTSAGIAEEEHLAHRVETAALNAVDRPLSAGVTGRHIAEPSVVSSAAPHPPMTFSAQSQPPTSAQASPAARPMPAPGGRNLDRVPAQPAATPDMVELSESLYRDLLRRIKADSERGG